MLTASDSPPSQTHQSLDSSPGVTAPLKDGGSYRFLSDVIMARGLVEPAAMKSALQASLAGRSLTAILVERGDIGEADLARAVAEHHRLDFVDLDVFAIAPEASALIDAEIARRIGAVPIAFMPSGELVVAMHDPTGTPAARDLALLTDRKIQPVIATRAQIVATIESARRAPAATPAPPAPLVADAVLTAAPAPAVVVASTHAADVLRPAAAPAPADPMPSGIENDERVRVAEQRAKAAEQRAHATEGHVSAADARAEGLVAAAVAANEALARAVGNCEVLERDAARREGEMQALRAELASERDERARLEARLLERRPQPVHEIEPVHDLEPVHEIEPIHEIEAYVAPVEEPVVEEDPPSPSLREVPPAPALTIDIPGTPGVPYVRALAPMPPPAAPRKGRSANDAAKANGLRRLIGALKGG